MQVAGLMTRQDWCLPIIIIKPMNTVKNIHCNVCMTYLLDNLMYCILLLAGVTINDQNQVKLIE